MLTTRTPAKALDRLSVRLSISAYLKGLERRSPDCFAQSVAQARDAQIALVKSLIVARRALRFAQPKGMWREDLPHAVVEAIANNFQSAYSDHQNGTIENVNRAAGI